MFKFLLRLIPKKERVFNDQTGILKVVTINEKKYVKMKNTRFFELVPQNNGKYKIFHPFINLSGELEFEIYK